MSLNLLLMMNMGLCVHLCVFLFVRGGEVKVQICLSHTHTAHTHTHCSHTHIAVLVKASIDSLIIYSTLTFTSKT